MYICTKTAVFNGARYAPGDHLPEGAVLPSRERTLLHTGVIARAEAQEPIAPQQPDAAPKREAPAKPKSKGGRSK